MVLLGAGVLGDSLGSLRDGVLGQLSRQQEPESSLDLLGGDGGPLVVAMRPKRLLTIETPMSGCTCLRTAWHRTPCSSSCHPWWPCQTSWQPFLVYLVTALVPSETACLASSLGSRSLTAVWISWEVMVDLLL